MNAFNKSSIITFFLIVVLIGACQTRKYKQSNNKAFQTDITEIRIWLKNYTEAIKATDVERILSYVTDDICYLPPNQASFSGKENLRKWLLAYFNYFTPKESLNLLDFEVYGDFAYLTGTYTVSGKKKQSGEEFKDKGKFVNFFKRQSKGDWICTQSTWNSDNQIFDIHSQILDDFSGTWVLDLSKSITPPGINSSKLVIGQKGNNLNITRTSDIKDKAPEISLLNYKIGSESQYNLKSGNFTIISTLSSGKQTFTICEILISEKSGTKHEYKRTTVYSLTAKGGILNIISDEILPKGSVTLPNNGHSEMIYTKL
jgi:ketosteroid isomerase-like protein